LAQNNAAAAALVVVIVLVLVLVLLVSASRREKRRVTHEYERCKIKSLVSFFAFFLILIFLFFFFPLFFVFAPHQDRKILFFILFSLTQIKYVFCEIAEVVFFFF
tara:strand:- start:183 stop:497 length:315 start_codon:yes stop_codon:yes gene_type:complete